MPVHSSHLLCLSTLLSLSTKLFVATIFVTFINEKRKITHFWVGYSFVSLLVQQGFLNYFLTLFSVISNIFFLLILDAFPLSDVYICHLLCMFFSVLLSCFNFLILFYWRFCMCCQLSTRLSVGYVETV